MLTRRAALQLLLASPALRLTRVVAPLAVLPKLYSGRILSVTICGHTFYPMEGPEEFSNELWLKGNRQ